MEVLKIHAWLKKKQKFHLSFKDAVYSKQYSQEELFKLMLVNGFTHIVHKTDGTIEFKKVLNK